MEHSGECYRNSNISPAVAEKFQAVLAARDLPEAKNGKYLGDYHAVSCEFVHADNDT